MAYWNFRGIFRRALEFPENGEVEAVSPANRARIRYNTRARQLEASIDQEVYTPLTLSGGASGPLGQATWYIDAVNGDDGNDGLTAATALATFGEYALRVGTGIATVAQTVNILSALTEDLRVSAQYPLGLLIQGQRTTLYDPGVVSAATAWDGTTTPVTDGTLTDAGLPGTWSNSGPGGTSLVGKLIVMTSGANVGKTGWVLADLGGKTARISKLIDAATFATGTPAVADTYDVVDLTLITGKFIMNDGPGTVDVQDLDVAPATGSPVSVTSGTWVTSNAKYRTTANVTSTVNNAAGLLVGALFTTTLEVAASPTLPFFNCSFIDGRVRVTASPVSLGFVCPCQKAGGLLATSEFLSSRQGGRIVINAGGVVGVVDQTAGAPAAARVDPGGELEVASGSIFFTIGQTVGTGCIVDSYGHALWPAGGSAVDFYDFDVSGPAVEWNIGGAANTSAGLAGVGSITAANNAGAVPRT